jgi:hypothetical protein
MIAVSRIANSNAKKTGAIRANSTAAEPRRLRPKRRKTFLIEAVGAAGDAISEFHTSDNGLAIKK